MTQTIIETSAAADVDVNEVADRFFRDGIAIVTGVLSAEECALLREKTDEIFDEPAKKEASRHPNELVISNPLLHDKIFADLFTREPILSLAEAVLGRETRFCGEHVVRNPPGTAISRWHLDDCNMIDFPLPPDIPRHDARIRLPVYWISMQIPLTDIDTIQDGPTEVVLGSHYSGRVPESQDNPHFDGEGPTPIFCKAGDMYLFNHQVWHRGCPNTSQRTRYLLQLQYAQGGTRASRFQGLASSPELEHVLAGADERTLRVLGQTKPTYGLNP